MNQLQINNQDVLAALKDADIDEKTAEEILKNFNLKKWDRVTQMILSQRAKIVSDVHSKQNNLYCIDFLLQKIKEVKSGKTKGAEL